jgi:hypothetical protein
MKNKEVSISERLRGLRKLFTFDDDVKGFFTFSLPSVFQNPSKPPKSGAEWGSGTYMLISAWGF